MNLRYQIKFRNTIPQFVRSPLARPEISFFRPFSNTLNSRKLQIFRLKSQSKSWKNIPIFSAPWFLRASSRSNDRIVSNIPQKYFQNFTLSLMFTAAFYALVPGYLPLNWIIVFRVKCAWPRAERENFPRYWINRFDPNFVLLHSSNFFQFN